MILVLAVLVAVAAMVMPALHGPMSDQRLKKAADLVRAQWTKTRVKAMQTGRVYLFRYNVATDRYAVEPWCGEVDMTEATGLDESLDAMITPVEDGRDQLLGVAGHQLPSGITFFAGETRNDQRSGEVLNQSADASAQADSNAAPIVFYPDGSASDARVILTNERFFVEVSLRGLIGLTRVSDLLSQEELSESQGAVP